MHLLFYNSTMINYLKKYIDDLEYILDHPNSCICICSKIYILINNFYRYIIGTRYIAAIYLRTLVDYNIIGTYFIVNAHIICFSINNNETFYIITGRNSIII